MEFSNNKRFFIIFALLLSCIPAMSQVVEPQVDSTQLSLQDDLGVPRTHQDSIEFGLILPDAVPVVADTTKAEEILDPGYSAKKLKMQARYTPSDAQEFTRRNFFSNIFGAVAFDYYMPLSVEMVWGPVASFYAGKRFTKVSGIRANINMGLMYDVYYDWRQIQAEVMLDYTANFSAMLGGYNKYRMCEISGIIGAGIHSERRQGVFRTTPAGHFGLNFNFHILKKMDLFIEPNFVIMGYKTDGTYVTDNWRKYNTAVCLSFGLAFHSVDMMRWPEAPGINWYFFGSLGPQWQNSKIVYNLGVGRTLGYAFSAGAGFHLLKWMDMHAGFFYNSNGWNVDTRGKRLNTSYGGIRFEGYFDVVNMITKRDDTLFSGGFFFGPEIGLYNKKVQEEEKDTYGKLSGLYFGLTMGLQAKARVYKNLKVFVEPRFNLVPYKAKSYDPSSPGMQKFYYDGLVNFNVGIEYHIPRRK